MQTTKAKYIKKVIELFGKGRYQDLTELRVWRWLSSGADRKAKDEALADLWEQTLADTPADTSEADAAFRRWEKHNLQDGAHARFTAAPATSRLRIWQSVAAVLTIGVLSMGWALTRRNATSEPARMLQAYCPPGETRKLLLPDGSEATLNGSTTITYPERFDGSRRDVLLMGEATFKVAKDADKPFTVSSADVDVTALGTCFNVKAYPVHGNVEATLLEGSVRVAYGKVAFTDSVAGSKVLSPGDQLVFHRDTRTAEICAPHVDDITAWQRGEIVFNNVSLAEIVAELENRFTHKFVYNVATLSPDRYTFRFRRGMTLADVMKVMEDVTGTIRCSVDSTTCKIRPAS